MKLWKQTIRPVLLTVPFGITSVSVAFADDTLNWKTGAPLPQPVQEIYSDVYNGLIYVGGGILAGDRKTDQFTAYDPKKDEWVNLAPLPASRHHITLSAQGDSIYGVGGFSGVYPNWQAHDTVTSYNIQTNTWSEAASLPEPRGEHVSAVVNDKIYVIGGRVPNVAEADHFDEYEDTVSGRVFDTVSQRWTEIADAPTARNSAAAAVINGLIYVVGGRDNQALDNGDQRIVNLPALEVYDPKTNRWETRAPMPQGQGGLGAAAVDGKLYVFGGEEWFPTPKVFDDVWVYDPQNDTWRSLPALPTPRHGVTAATVDDQIFVLGGATTPGLGAVAVNEALTISP